MIGRKNQCISAYLKLPSHLFPDCVWPLQRKIRTNQLRNCKFFSSIAFRSAMDICQCPTFSSNTTPPKKNKHLATGKSSFSLGNASSKGVGSIAMLVFRGGLLDFSSDPIRFKQFPSLENIKHHWNPRLQDISPGLGLNGVMGHL